jgi:hypothetical protein
MMGANVVLCGNSGVVSMMKIETPMVVIPTTNNQRSVVPR